MKTTFLCTQTLVAGLLLAGLFAAVPVAAQERPDCTTCTCGDNLFYKDCYATCCKPHSPMCDCGTFYCRASCIVGSYDLPEIYEQNIRDFGIFMRTSLFTSTPAMNLANDIPLYLEAYFSGSVETFFTIADRMETNSKQLAGSEKMVANQWIVARGGRPNTIP